MATKLLIILENIGIFSGNYQNLIVCPTRVKVYSGYILAVCQLCVPAAHFHLGLTRSLVDDRPTVLPLVIGSVQHQNAVLAESLNLTPNLESHGGTV